MAQLGKYEILEEIGRGGFGVVYKARDLSLERDVALKVLHPQLTVDPRFIENFKREARNLAKIYHPNVVKVHEILELQGRLFIAMQFLPGGSLKARLKDKESLAYDEVFKIVKEISAGLEAGHKQKIIHRDVKPGNILFDEEGRAVIADFGVARAVQISSLGMTTHSSGTVGTPFYRPPELWRGEPPPSPATDVYSLACVVYEMLTGDVLFKGETPDQVLTRHVLEDIADLIGENESDLSTGLFSVLTQALVKDPANRYPSMGAFLRALEPHLIPRESPVETIDALDVSSHEDQSDAIPGTDFDTQPLDQVDGTLVEGKPMEEPSVGELAPEAANKIKKKLVRKPVFLSVVFFCVLLGSTLVLSLRGYLDNLSTLSSPTNNLTQQALLTQQYGKTATHMFSLSKTHLTPTKTRTVTPIIRSVGLTATRTRTPTRTASATRTNTLIQATRTLAPIPTSTNTQPPPLTNTQPPPLTNTLPPPPTNTQPPPPTNTQPPPPTNTPVPTNTSEARPPTPTPP